MQKWYILGKLLPRPAPFLLHDESWESLEKGIIKLNKLCAEINLY